MPAKFDGHHEHYVGVMSHKYIPGEGQSRLLWAPIPGEPPPLTVVRLKDALETHYPTDAHMVGYVVYDPSGARRAIQPRIVKDELREVLRRGFTVRHHALIADVDTPGHLRITPEQVEDARDRLAEVPTIGWFTSRGGLRVLQPLAKAIVTDHYEGILPEWLARLQRVLGERWVVDFACLDWTRLFRLPFVRRDGAATEPVFDFARMTSIAPPAPPPRPKAPAPSERERLLARLAALRPNDTKLARARKYVATIPTPRCGTSSCAKAAFRVACVLVEKGLQEEEAYTLLSEWADRGEHEWKPNELRRKVADATARTSEGRRSRGGAR